MTFKVKFNESTRVVESRVHGNFDWDLVDKMVPAIGRAVLKAKTNLIFIDFRNCKVNMSTVRIYETPKKIGEEFAKVGVEVKNMRRAILINTDQSDFDFLQNVTINNAQILKLFYDEASAMEWLASLRDTKPSQ